MPASRLYVGVVGPGEATAEEARAAEAIGRGLAQGGAIVVTGGHGGVMAAASRGAAEAGGIAVGILPGSNRSGANQWASITIPTGLGELRNGLIARACRGMIAIGGGYGTLSEVAFMLRLGRPVCAVSSWELVPPGGEIGDPAIHRATGAEDAVTWVLAHL